MKTNITFILALSLAGTMAQAAPQSSPTVAVYGFTGAADVASLAGKITTLVTADLTTETNLALVERAELKKALNEQALGLSGMVSSDAAAKIGQLTGAKVLVAGQVIKTGGDHLFIVANIIGTETGRLFADQVDGPVDNLAELASNLSRKIAQTISDQATNLIAAAQESPAERVARIVKSINGPNRPAVSVSIVNMHPWSKNHILNAEAEFGSVLLKAGFPVVDGNSDQKSDIEIIGDASYDTGPAHNGFFSARGVIELKVQERRTGRIIAFDHQESAASDPGRHAAMQAAEADAVDKLAERIFPLLAK